MNMSKIVTASIISLLKMLVSGSIVAHIQELVLNAAKTNVPGEQKKALVMDSLKSIGGDLGKAIADVAPSLINLVIEAAVAYLKARS